MGIFIFAHTTEDDRNLECVLR